MDRLWTLSPGPPLLSSFLQSGQRPTSRHDRSSILALQGRAQGFALGWELFGPQGADAQGVALGLPRELPWACLKAFLTSWMTRSVSLAAMKIAGFWRYIVDIASILSQRRRGGEAQRV